MHVLGRLQKSLGEMVVPKADFSFVRVSFYRRGPSGRIAPAGRKRTMGAQQESRCCLGPWQREDSPVGVEKGVKIKEPARDHWLRVKTEGSTGHCGAQGRASEW